MCAGISTAVGDQPALIPEVHGQLRQGYGLAGQLVRAVLAEGDLACQRGEAQLLAERAHPLLQLGARAHCHYIMTLSRCSFTFNFGI